MRCERAALAKRGEILPVARERLECLKVAFPQAMHRRIFRAHTSGRATEPRPCGDNPSAQHGRDTELKNARGKAALEIDKMNLLFNPTHECSHH